MTSVLRILPLGGLGEIGKNMTAFEYEDDILIVDAGVMFPENDMLGVDLIIPDYHYLMEEDRLSKIRAILITHGHEDHIGALPHMIEDIRAPIYATPLTLGLIEAKLREARRLDDIELVSFRAGEVLQIGPFKVEPFHVAHSIPDCVGFGITTPAGLIVHTGDYKFDHTPIDNWPPDFAKLAEFSQRGVLALLAHSTNADRAGWTESEMDLAQGFEDVFRNAPGRIIVATFASLISRVQIAAAAALKFDRKLAIAGRSMRDAVKIARKLGYPTFDPHGDPIPDRHGRLAAAGAGLPLTALEPGCPARLTRVHAQDGERLRYLGELGLYPGAQVTVSERAPFQGPLLVQVNGAPQMLAFDLAAELSVEMNHA